jgi:hypothetical protein
MAWDLFKLRDNLPPIHVYSKLNLFIISKVEEF